MTIKLGITGGIGSGKSIVSHLLEIMGIPMYIADTEAKRLTSTHPQIRRQLIALLGEDIYQDNRLNKPLLSQYLFGHPDHARLINGIIHPYVKEDFRRWVTAHSHFEIVGMEAAILVEAGFSEDVDTIVMIYAPREIRIERTMRRDNCSREAIIRRVESQMNDEEKKMFAHYTIVNDGKRSIIPQVEAILNTIRNKKIT